LIRDYFSIQLESLHKDDLFRELEVSQGPVEPESTVQGKKVINFCSNNYLGLANNPRLKAGARQSLDKYGTGSGASRLVSGNLDIHETLEDQIASFMNSERAVLFNSGYQANTGIIPSITTPEDAIFSDASNHASIIDGCRLSKASIFVFPHNDIGALKKLLIENKAYRKKIILVEGVYSMDGDLAPLPEITSLAKKYGAIVVVDEAHSIGVFGKSGRGVSDHFDVEEDIDIRMGTFGKALGSFGAFAATRGPIADFLINRARTLIFSTALPAATCGANLAAIELVQKRPELKKQLWENIRLFTRKLKNLGLEISEPTSQIIPIMVGEAEKAMNKCSLRHK
jgi:8-amino-7-oxononanoate synthase